MNNELAQIKNLAYLHVVELMATEGLSKADACEKAGVAVTTFDRAMAENPALGSEFVTVWRTTIQDRYADIVTAHRDIFDAIIAKATPEALKDMNIQDLILLEKSFREMQGVTEKQLGFLGGPEQDQGAANKLLQAIPKIGLRPGRAKISQRTTMEISFDLTGEPSHEEMPQNDIIDGETQDVFEGS